MVHRTSDSRLLVALLSAEQNYSKALYNLLASSQPSLASFSAYASASTPPTSHTILAVAGSLASADDALGKYARAVDTWREELESLKKLEEDVANVVRDREILVTRLIKVSKAQKPTRDSFIFPSSSAPSNSSLSLPSPSTKLATAQAQLQACEAHLVDLEKSVEERRIETVKQGLSVRFRAMVECGWAWGEMGKEGLSALENLDSKEIRAGPFQLTPPSSISHSHSSPSKRTSAIGREDARAPPSSDLSVSPSQSTSNICLPAAHKIDDLIFPTSSSTDHSHVAPSAKHILSHRISEVTEPSEDERDAEDDSSEDIPVQVHVVENERFADYGPKAVSKDRHKLKVRPRRFSTRSTPPTNDISPFPKERERKSSFFGSIRGLFKGKAKEGDMAQDDSDDGIGPRMQRHTIRSDASPTLSGRGVGRLYSGRIGGSVDDWNMRSRFRDENDGDHSGAESDPGGMRVAGPKRRTHKKSQSDVGAGARSAKVKGKMVEEWVGKQSREHLLTDSPSTSQVQTPSRTRKPHSAKMRRGARDLDLQTKLNTDANGGLSRNSSITSAHTAPPIPSTSTPRPSRSASSRSTQSSPAKQGRSVALSSAGQGAISPGEGSMSLMSIVEGIGRSPGLAESNAYLPSRYQAASHGQPGLIVPKAPPRITRADIDGLPTVTLEESGSVSSFLNMSKVRESMLAGSSVGLVAFSGPVVRRNASDGHDSDEVRRIEASKLSSLSPPAPVKTRGARASRPARSPLRSALRGSRTPSPIMRTPDTESAEKGKAVAHPEHLPVQNGATKDDDAVSVSSYETGRETLNDHDDAFEPSSSLPVLKASDETNGDANAGPSVDESTSPPARRKSVRVSLQPQFSPTPPAFDGNDEEPWPVAEQGVKDMWEDSSEEDEEYARAKRLLGRLAKRVKAPH